MSFLKLQGLFPSTIYLPSKVTHALLSINSPEASSRGKKQLCFFADSPHSLPPSSQRGVCYESCGQLCCESHKKDIFHLSFFLLSLPLSLSIRQRFIPSLMPVACGAGRGQGRH